MIAKRFKIKRLGYSYHPDFVQVDNEPKGYRILPTGQWIVEYVAYDVSNSDTPQPPKHCRHGFATEEQAKKFENKVRRGFDEKDCILIGNDNMYLLRDRKMPKSC